MSGRFTFMYDYETDELDKRCGNSEKHITYTTDADTVVGTMGAGILNDFQQFLEGCGYSFGDNIIDVVSIKED